MIFIIHIIVSILFFVQNVNSSSPTPDYTNHLMTTWNNNSFYGFRGIRYAQPPIGNLRFKDPIPYEPSWNITHLSNVKTTIDNPPCPSPYTLDRHNEDCLFLNVYTQNPTASMLMPVLLFIHPGGFYVGSGNTDHFGPEYLLDHSIVLVTFNYRLSFLGLAANGDQRAPGNAALKDQLLVLRWIAQNVHHFGGDAACVTIVGTSAGAMSVALHLATPKTIQLFHRAVIMSGSIPPLLEFPNDQRELLARQAKLLNCSLPDPFDCVATADTNALATSVYKMFEFVRDNPIFNWLPVNNGHFIGDEQPLRAIGAGRFEKIPILIGTTRDELTTSAYELLSGSSRSKWTDDFQRWAPICLMYERTTQRSAEISTKLYWNYYQNQSTSSTFRNTSKLFSDALINFPVYRLATLASQHTDVFYYKFQYRGGWTNFNNRRPIVGDDDLMKSIQTASIVEHCDDLQYLFTSIYWPRIERRDSVEAKVVERQTRMLVSFAKNGRPDVGGDHHQMRWPKFTAQEEFYCELGEDVTIRRKPLVNADFWNDIISL